MRIREKKDDRMCNMGRKTWKIFVKEYWNDMEYKILHILME